jgi:hypothetical protein
MWDDSAGDDGGGAGGVGANGAGDGGGGIRVVVARLGLMGSRR